MPAVSRLIPVAMPALSRLIAVPEVYVSRAEVWVPRANGPVVTPSIPSECPDEIDTR